MEFNDLHHWNFKVRAHGDAPHTCPPTQLRFGDAHLHCTKRSAVQVSQWRAVPGKTMRQQPARTVVEAQDMNTMEYEKAICFVNQNDEQSRDDLARAYRIKKGK